ncbi:MAG: class II aldolase/adducin family protein [Nocardioides sp.]
MNPRAAAASAVADAARRLAAEGLLIGTAGNLSMRVDGTEEFVVTRSGVVLAECAPEDVCSVAATGAVLSGSARPSSEVGLHLGLYADLDIAAVVHTHAPWSTAVACVLDELPVVHYQQLLLGGAIRVAPYATFGSEELAALVRAALVDRQAALMANHGAVAVAKTLDQAVENALLLEWLATLHHRASVLGTPRPLTTEQQADVIAAVLDRGYGHAQEDHP